MMMRHLASVGETYAQTAIDDTAWNLWPMNPPQAAATGSPITPTVAGRYPGNTGGLHMRPASHNDNLANILAMAETVREVLPHIPDELILEVRFGFYVCSLLIFFACSSYLLHFCYVSSFYNYL